MDSSEPAGSQLNWLNVGLAFGFILLNAGLSKIYKLKIGLSLITAAIRCVVQLALVALLLQTVFETNNPWAVAAIACVLNLLGSFEAVVNKSKRRHENMFRSVLFGMLGSTIPTSILGARFAMSVDPFWTPAQYIPIVGMLCGSTISGIVVAVTYVLKELQENRDRVEVLLAFGATRMEACQPVAIDALLLALTPVINQMSVLGIIAIPGMMTGAILGGTSVQQAAKLQMIIMFMISSSTALSSIFTTIFAIRTVLDKEHRIRDDRIYSEPLTLWKARGVLWVKTKESMGRWRLWLRTRRLSVRTTSLGEAQLPLLQSPTRE